MIVLLAGYGSLHWMESPQFCGQVCHTPMHPQFTAWQDASHAKVACVQCHIGEGARAFVHYKTGRRPAAVHVVTNNSAADPGRGRHAAGARDLRQLPLAGPRGRRPLRVSRTYADDEANTETATA